MNIIRMGRGDFFGIIVPGVFLLSNLLYLVKISMSDSNYINLSMFSNNEVILYAFLLVSSYIIGFSLRLIRPDYIEKVSAVLWITARTIQFVPFSVKWRHFQFNKKRFIQLRHTWKYYWESFPYMDWFIKSYVERQSSNYKIFFHNMFGKQYSIPIVNKDFHSFINFCKTFIFHNAPNLKEEVIYFEGLIRLLTGMAYASLLCLLASILVNYLMRPINGILFLLYLILLFTFTIKIRHMRCREVVHTFDSFIVANGIRFELPSMSEVNDKKSEIMTGKDDED